MRVGQARSAAADWIAQYGSDLRGFCGAYVSGSTVALPPDAELPVASDLDVVIVVAAGWTPAAGGAAPAIPLGKLRHHGALLDVSTITEDRLATPAQVLGDYRLASSFRVGSVIADPTGRLGRLQAAVAAGFASRLWVQRRLDDVCRVVEERIAGVAVPVPFPDQVLRWLFAAGGTVHLPLVAALRNPTVRLRYLAAREVLAGYGLGDRYPELLELLGCARLSCDRVAGHLDGLARTFDATAAVARTPLFFSSDITPLARPVAIGGSRVLVERGDHREAVFWMVATYARCHTILAVDAPDLRRELKARPATSGTWPGRCAMHCPACGSWPPRSSPTTRRSAAEHGPVHRHVLMVVDNSRGAENLLSAGL